jgi:hypothetical protein
MGRGNASHAILMPVAGTVRILRIVGGLFRGSWPDRICLGMAFRTARMRGGRELVQLWLWHQARKQAQTDTTAEPWPSQCHEAQIGDQRDSRHCGNSPYAYSYSIIARAGKSDNSKWRKDGVFGVARAVATEPCLPLCTLPQQSPGFGKILLANPWHRLLCLRIGFRPPLGGEPEADSAVAAAVPGALTACLSRGFPCTNDVASP